MSFFGGNAPQIAFLNYKKRVTSCFWLVDLFHCSIRSMIFYFYSIENFFRLILAYFGVLMLKMLIKSRFFSPVGDFIFFFEQIEHFI